jgi:hypothetical protein
MSDYENCLTRFHSVTNNISPSSVVFRIGEPPLELYDEAKIIDILEELNPEMANLIKEFGLERSLNVLERLELFQNMGTKQVN